MSFFRSIGAFLAARLGEASTIIGLASVSGAAVGLMLHAIAWPAAIPILVGGAVAVLMPQNPNRTAIVNAATLAVQIATGKSIAVNIGGETTTITVLGRVS